MQSRTFVFTLNNYNELEEKKLQGLDCRYLIYGRELAPTTGTPHLQGYVYFDKRKTFADVFRMLPERAHMEVAKGSPAQNHKYCSKDGDYFEKGIPPKDPKQNLIGSELWDAARASARAGSFEDIPSSLYCRYIGNFKRIRADALQEKPPDDLDKACGHWLYGVPRSGKSYSARHQFQRPFIKSANKWWDGYNPDLFDGAIIDDMDPSLCKALAHYLKIWMDAYAFNAETKGGVIFIRPKYIVVTSNYSIDECFDGVDADAVKERCVVKFFPFPFVSK